MSQVIKISDALYARLEAEARQRGLDIEQLLEEWERKVAESKGRDEVVLRIDRLRERMFATYGEMPDSTQLISADRER